MIEPSVASQLAGIVGDGNVVRDAAALQEASRDYSWMSPILRRELDGMLADLVVRPGSPDEVARVAELAHRHDVPVTGRGRGTGNYGQAVPLAGGIVLDTSRLAEVIDLGDGWITAAAGTTFVALETAARRSGQELVMFPSTIRSSLGGFVCGGAGGTGSVEHGFLWDGFVSALETVGCVEGAEPEWVEGAEVSPFLHAFGTTGLVTAATVRLEPVRRWTALIASFAEWGAALDAAWLLINRSPLPRSVSVDEASLVALFPSDPAMPSDRVSLRAIVEGDDVVEVERIVAEAGGRTEAVRPDGTAQLVSLSYNHVTLRAVRANPSLCHVQVGGPLLASRADDVRASLPGAMLHVDCHKLGPDPWFGGLLISEFRDDPTLRQGMADLRELGVGVVDPHTYRLGAHADLTAMWRQAARSDPKGLLNPGKLPSRPLPDDRSSSPDRGACVGPTTGGSR